MIWKGKELLTIGDVMRHGIDQCFSKAEATEFMELYSAENPYAKENIGYLAGYYDNDKKHQIFEWFDCSHPVFGRSDPTFQEAFQAGLDCGRKSARRSEQKQGNG